MKPIPVDFHIGPLQVHTYGIGLALTFWFGYTYFERRLRKHGYRTDWFLPVFLWIILAAVVGARVLHVLSNLSYYSSNPGDVLAVWHGGLSSFGGLLFAVPTGIVLTRRRCPELALGRALDLAAPVLMACWAMGRLLGPQLMVAGGGHPTHQWFGMYYAGQAGRRLPVPIFQALEDFAVYLVLIAIERRLDRWPDRSPRSGYPPGIVLGTGMVLWGIERSVDEHLWLGEDGRVGSDLVQLAGIALVVGGVVILLRTRARWQQWLRLHHSRDETSRPDDDGSAAGGSDDEGAAVAGSAVGGSDDEGAAVAGSAVGGAAVGGLKVERSEVEPPEGDRSGPEGSGPGDHADQVSASDPTPSTSDRAPSAPETSQTRVR